MPRLQENAFTFTSHALPEDTFTVVRFSGEERLSTMYSFDILLVSEHDDLDLSAVLQNPATLTIKGATIPNITLSKGDANSWSSPAIPSIPDAAGLGGDLPYHGILSAFEQLHQADGHVFYRAELRPRLWWLTQTHGNQVFLNKKPLEFLMEVLEDGGLRHGLDAEFRYKGTYPVWEYVCQYNESHFNFLSRWMERGGAYYWFEQGEHVEKLIATDTLIAHTPLSDHETFSYAPVSGLDASHATRTIKRFTLRQSPVPKNVRLKDYDSMKPSLDLEGRAQIMETGRGEIYRYGDHFLDKAQCEHLAQVRAEEYSCREKIFHGLSASPALRPGYLFTLDKHYRQDFNQQYLTVAVRHEGSQERFLMAGLGIQDLDDADGLFYRNTFECIPAATQFRPALVTPKPRIAGTLSAKIDAAESGKYAELDEHGRYKVILPFDLSGRKDGKASAWLRMMQPYAGENMGFHAPLHKGTEVLLSFIEGDPDRPVIAGAVPNPDTPSPVLDTNQTHVRLVTGGGNALDMDDSEGRQRILVTSPTGESMIRLGQQYAAAQGPSGPAEPAQATGEGGCAEVNTQGIRIRTTKDLRLECDKYCQQVTGDATEKVEGNKICTVEGEAKVFKGGASQTFFKDTAFEIKADEGYEVSMGAKASASLAADFSLEAGVKGIAGFGWKWTFHELKEKFIAEENTLEGAKNKLQGEINKLIGDHNKLVGAVSSMSASSEHLSAQVSRLTMATQDLNGQVRRIAAEEDNILASRTSMIGEALSSILDETENAGAMMQIAGDKTQLLGIEEKI